MQAPGDAARAEHEAERWSGCASCSSPRPAVLLFKLRSEDAQARFWLRVLGINFAIGAVTGIPMEFQFGTNDCAAGDLSTAAREAVGLDETEESLDDLGVHGRHECGAE